MRKTACWKDTSFRIYALALALAGLLPSASAQEIRITSPIVGQFFDLMPGGKPASAFTGSGITFLMRIPSQMSAHVFLFTADIGTPSVVVDMFCTADGNSTSRSGQSERWPELAYVRITRSIPQSSSSESYGISQTFNLAPNFTQEAFTEPLNCAQFALQMSNGSGGTANVKGFIAISPAPYIVGVNGIVTPGQVLLQTSEHMPKPILIGGSDAQLSGTMRAILTDTSGRPQVGVATPLGSSANATGGPPTGQVQTSGTFVSYSPAQLGANALTLPASGTTVSTNTIDLRAVRELTLFSNCGQANSINWTIFAEDGTTSLATNATFISSAGAGGNLAQVGSESNPLPSNGTVSLQVRLPQRAVAFSWTNGTATPSTCTARLFLTY